MEAIHMRAGMKGNANRCGLFEAQKEIRGLNMAQAGCDR